MMNKKRIIGIWILILGFSVAMAEGIKIEDLLEGISKQYKVSQENLQNEEFTVKEEMLLRVTKADKKRESHEEAEENKISFFQGKWKKEIISISLEKIETAKDKKKPQTLQDTKNRYLGMIGDAESDEKSQNETSEIPDAFQQLDELYRILESKDYTINYIKEGFVGTYSCHLIYFEPKKKKVKDEDATKGYLWIGKNSFSIIQAKFGPAKLSTFTKKCECFLSCSPYQQYWLPQRFITEMEIGFLFIKMHTIMTLNYSDYTFGGFK